MFIGWNKQRPSLAERGKKYGNSKQLIDVSEYSGLDREKKKTFTATITKTFCLKKNETFCPEIHVSNETIRRLIQVALKSALER